MVVVRLDQVFNVVLVVLVVHDVFLLLHLLLLLLLLLLVTFTLTGAPVCIHPRTSRTNGGVGRCGTVFLVGLVATVLRRWSSDLARRLALRARAHSHVLLQGAEYFVRLAAGGALAGGGGLAPGGLGRPDDLAAGEPDRRVRVEVVLQLRGVAVAVLRSVFAAAFPRLVTALAEDTLGLVVLGGLSRLILLPGVVERGCVVEGEGAGDPEPDE